MKNFYIVASVKENNKYYAYVIKVSENNNLMPKLCNKNIQHANICPTRKKAYSIADLWNTCYKENNEYYFDEPTF